MCMQWNISCIPEFDQYAKKTSNNMPLHNFYASKYADYVVVSDVNADYMGVI